MPDDRAHKGRVDFADGILLKDMAVPTTEAHGGQVYASGSSGNLYYKTRLGTVHQITPPSGGGGGVTDHGALTGLADDDHTQYLLADGSRQMSGSLDMNGNDIANAGTFNTVDIESHASRHERGGSDEIDGDHLDIDYTPSNYTPSTSPSEAANVDDLAAHLAGIDNALSGGGGDLVSTNNLSDVASEDASISNLINGGTSLGDIAALDDEMMLRDTSAVAGRVITLSELFASKMQVVAKVTDEERAFDTTPSIDSDLVVDVESGVEYGFRLWMMVDAGSTPDFKYELDGGSAGMSQFQVVRIIFRANNSSSNVSGNNWTDYTTTDNIVHSQWPLLYIVEGTFTPSGDGTFGPQWSQRTNSVFPAIMKAGSKLVVWKNG